MSTSKAALMDATTVRKVARLARLRLQEEEVAVLERDLARILGYFEQLQAVDTSAVAPMVHATAGPTPMRPDAVAASLGTDAAVANGPAVRDGSFAVPKVIGGS